MVSGYIGIYSSNDVLVETSKTSDNEYQVINIICQEIKVNRSRGLYGTFYNSYYLYDLYDDYYFILICDMKQSIRIGLSLIENVRKDFFYRFITQRQKLNRDLYREWCTQELNFYLNNSSADKIRGITIEVNEIKRIMDDNVQKALLRGEKLEDLKSQTHCMEDEATELFIDSKKLKRRKCLKYYCCCCFSSCFVCCT